jgi:hypothetical protein
MTKKQILLVVDQDLKHTIQIHHILSGTGYWIVAACNGEFTVDLTPEPASRPGV